MYVNKKRCTKIITIGFIKGFMYLSSQTSSLFFSDFSHIHLGQFSSSGHRCSLCSGCTTNLTSHLSSKSLCSLSTNQLTNLQGRGHSGLNSHFSSHIHSNLFSDPSNFFGNSLGHKLFGGLGSSNASSLFAGLTSGSFGHADGHGLDDLSRGSLDGIFFLFDGHWCDLFLD